MLGELPTKPKQRMPIKQLTTVEKDENKRPESQKEGECDYEHS